MTKTEEMIQKYFDQKLGDDEAKRKRYFRMIARPELAEAEEQYGKDIFHFSIDELENYLTNMRLSTRFKNTGKSVSQANMRSIIGWYRDLFDFYMVETGEYFLNPFRDKRLTKLPGKVKDDLPIFTRDTLEKLAVSCETVFSEGEAAMMQSILWMHYCGCFSLNEILDIKDDDVNLDDHYAVLEDRRINLTPECVEALRNNHRVEFYSIHNARNYMCPYHGSYLWLPFKTKAMQTYQEEYNYAMSKQQERPADQMRHVVSIKLTKLRNETGVIFAVDTIYYRGIYDFLVEKCGEEHTKEIIESATNSKLGQIIANELQDYLIEYGARVTSKTEHYRIKNAMKQFIEE